MSKLMQSKWNAYGEQHSRLDDYRDGVFEFEKRRVRVFGFEVC